MSSVHVEHWQTLRLNCLSIASARLHFTLQGKKHPLQTLCSSSNCRFQDKQHFGGRCWPGNITNQPAPAQPMSDACYLTIHCLPLAVVTSLSQFLFARRPPQ